MSGNLGVVILVYGGGGRHEPLLESLLQQRIAAEDIVVVHNPASPGETPPPPPSGCELLQADRNLGYAGGMNLGLTRQLERGADPILLLTHDARLRPGALDLLLAASDRAPCPSVLGPALFLSDSDRPFSFGGITRASGATAHLTQLPPSTADGIVPCDWIDGGTMLVRREVVYRTGGFDERFWSYCEEADFCLRARKAGFQVAVVADARAEQSPGASHRIGAWAYLTTRNGIAYAHRAKGARGMIGFMSECVFLVVLHLSRAAARALRIRPGDRREPFVLAIGMARGMVDYARGRWGAPPPGLPGLGDIRNV